MAETQTATNLKSEIILEGMIDYAGLFPPANLDMQTVVSNWNDYLKSNDSWMLARLIVPSSRLEEFKNVASGLLPNESEEPWQLSVLLPQASSEEFEAAVNTTVDFNMEDCGGVANVVEFKAATNSEIDQALSVLHDDLFPFVEFPIDEDPRGLVAALAGSNAGMKVRTGGVTPDLYPSAENLARFIHTCATSHQPFKATAGMHHPLQHRNENVGVNEFGFLNVLQATAAARYFEASIDELVLILNSNEADLNGFEDETLATVRAELFCSFGSCSFDEPRQDLRSMGLLKETT